MKVNLFIFISIIIGLGCSKEKHAQAKFEKQLSATTWVLYSDMYAGHQEFDSGRINEITFAKNHKGKDIYYYTSDTATLDISWSVLTQENNKQKFPPIQIEYADENENKYAGGVYEISNLTNDKLEIRKFEAGDVGTKVNWTKKYRKK